MTLCDAAEVTIGRQRSPKHAYGDYMVPYLRAANVKDGRLQLDDVLEMNFSPAEQAVFSLERGDVLVSEGCGSIAELGASARYNGELAGTVCFQNTLLRLRARPGIADPAFIELWARDAYATGAFARLANGTSIFHIGATRAQAMPVPLPPLAVQRRIVDLVMSVDGAIDDARSAAAAHAEMARVLREEAFDDRNIAAVTLSSLCDSEGIQIGPFGSQLHARDYVADGVPSVMPQDMVDREISMANIRRVGHDNWQRLSRHHLAPGDILLPRRGDLTKRAFVSSTQGGWLCGTGTVRIRVAHADPRCVFEALSVASVNRWLADHAVGATMPNLNTAIVAAIPVRVPTERSSTIGLLDALDDHRCAATRMADALTTLRSALLAELLSGTHEIPGSYDRLLESA